MACLAALAAPAVLSGCATSANVTGSITGSDLIVPSSAFDDPQRPGTYRDHVVVHEPSLGYPIAVYRTGPDDYHALLMRCTHQGSELRAAGGMLYCPSHGSEFNALGSVIKGPASAPLRVLPVRTFAQEIHISLKQA